MKTASILFLFAMLSIFVHAEKVEFQKALTIVENFVQSETTLRNNQINDIKLVYTAQSSPELRNSENNSTVCYYVFNINNNSFVIVSGDDIAIPVLAYSNETIYEGNNFPDGFAYWMNNIEKEIIWGIENKITQNEETKELWNNYLNSNISTLRSTQAVGPLIKTVWDQSEPYNNLCPTVDKEKTVTGCVVTAMAQIMKYYNYPAIGIGKSPAYTTTKNKIAIPSVDFNVNYDWSNMTNTYSGNSPQVQKDAVAKLMFHCGTSVAMDYATSNQGGSAAQNNSAAKALFTYFRYNQDIKLKYRSYYNDNEWENILKNEINSGRPVFYSGFHDTGGHSFICDGYENFYFHFNWGWSGSFNGYFATKILNPGTGGAGSGSGTYNKKQCIIHNIIPSPDETKSYDINLLEETQLISSVSSVKHNDYFTVSIHVRNTGIHDFTGYYSVVLTDENENIIQQIGTSLGPWPVQASYYFTNPFQIQCKVPTKVPAGNYKIRAAAKPTGSNNWILMKSSVGYAGSLDLNLKNTSNIENPILKNIKIFPNPSNEFIYIAFGESNIVKSIEISDLTGKILKTVSIKQPDSQITIPISDLTTSTYLVIIRTGQGTFSKKIEIIR